MINKSELIERAAFRAGVTKTLAKAVLDSVIDDIKNELWSGGEVAINGFGTFSVAKREARVGRNPRTGEPAPIPASKAPKFKASKALKDAVN